MLCLRNTSDFLIDLRECCSRVPVVLDAGGVEFVVLRFTEIYDSMPGKRV